MQFQIKYDISFKKPLSMLFHWLGRHWFQLAICFFMYHLFFNQGIQITVGKGGSSFIEVTRDVKIVDLKEPVQMGMTIPAKPIATKKEEAKPLKNWKSSDFRNLSFVLSPDLAQRKGVPSSIVNEKMTICRNYVERYGNTAIVEMEKYGIPASITLGQGLLESDAGMSKLATESNNHFGIKCRRKCRGCTCRNYSDDDIYDMFRVFDSVWESYREHSTLLSTDRYKHLKNLGTKDYKNWAHGLKKAGYATDKNYATKLIKIIEELDLHQFDK